MTIFVYHAEPYASGSIDWIDLSLTKYEQFKSKSDELDQSTVEEEFEHEDGCGYSLFLY